MFKLVKSDLYNEIVQKLKIRVINDDINRLIVKITKDDENGIGILELPFSVDLDEDDTVVAVIENEALLNSMNNPDMIALQEIPIEKLIEILKQIEKYEEDHE